jgi:hypothetical protein
VRGEIAIQRIARILCFQSLDIMRLRRLHT